MKRINQKCFVTLFSGLAGIADMSTGIGLVFLPAMTLGLMGLDASVNPDEWMRFIGSFVFGIGSLYIWGVYFQRRTGKWAPLLYAWLGSAWVRSCVAVVTSMLIFKGDLDTGWLSVPLTDGILALFQFTWIATGRFPKDG